MLSVSVRTIFSSIVMASLFLPPGVSVTPAIPEWHPTLYVAPFTQNALAAPAVSFPRSGHLITASSNRLARQMIKTKKSAVPIDPFWPARVRKAWNLQRNHPGLWSKILRTSTVLWLPLYPANASYKIGWLTFYHALMDQTLEPYPNRQPFTAGLEASQVARYGEFSEGERESLRNAAHVLTQFVRNGTALSVDRLHELHAEASAATRLHRANGEEPDGTIRVAKLRTILPPFFRGRFRDGQQYKLMMKTIDGKRRERRIIFDIQDLEDWELTASAHEVRENMDFLVDWINKNRSHPSNPVTLAARTYVFFVKIHPYLDVNDRTAWLLMNWILLSRGLAPFYITDQNLQVYLDAGNAVMEKPLDEAMILYQYVFHSLYENQNPRRLSRSA